MKLMNSFAAIFLFVSAIALNAAGAPVVITKQPEAASICKGSDHLVSVVATGTDLTYQWYRDNEAITGATQADYEILDALRSRDYGSYKVIIKGSDGPEVISNEVRIWVAEPLSTPLLLSIPDTAMVNRTTRLHVGNSSGYTDVYNYTWSFTEPNDGLNRSGSRLYNYDVRFYTPEPRQTVVVLIDHVCGPYVGFKHIRVQWPTGISDQTNDAAEVSVYPNPVEGDLNVKADGLNIKHITVIDLNGRTVYQAHSVDQNSILSAGEWPEGVYFVKIATEEGTTTHKIVKK